MKIKYSGLPGMQLQITAMIDTVQCHKDKHNFSLTWGARGLYRLYIHKTKVTWSDAGERVILPSATPIQLLPPYIVS